MRKIDILFVLALALFLLGLLETVSGFILWLALPHSGGNRGLETYFWGVGRTTWVDIHDWAAVVLLVVVALHVIYHWKWIIRMFRTCCPFLRKEG